MTPVMKAAEFDNMILSHIFSSPDEVQELIGKKDKVQISTHKYFMNVALL